jgi:hypothetical protein
VCVGNLCGGRFSLCCDAVIATRIDRVIIAIFIFIHPFSIPNILRSMQLPILSLHLAFLVTLQRAFISTSAVRVCRHLASLLLLGRSPFFRT